MYSEYEILSELTPEEKKAFRKKQNLKENINLINELYDDIKQTDDIIERTQNWIKKLLTKDMSMEELKKHILICTDLIQTCEEYKVVIQKEITHYTKYPLHSKKRDDWYTTKEGQQWLKQLLVKK